jgi:hypothetical protein
MTDINLKTLTPDTSLPKTGFLFGADSQATTDPSVYSTQTVATTLLGSTSLTGDTLTADAPVLNLAQTWNNAAVTFTGVKYNATSTASAAASLLMDLQVGGASKFRVDKTGQITTSAQAQFLNTTVFSGEVSFNGWSGITGPTSSGGALVLRLSNTNILTLSSGFARFGAPDAAAPVAQKLSVQSVVTGTTDGAGQNFTITGSQGTGAGVGGSIIFQTAAANTGGGATVQNTLADAMVIDSVKTVRLGTGYTVATLPAAGTAGRRTYVTDALAPVYLATLTGGGAVVCPVFDNGTAWVSA